MAYQIQLETFHGPLDLLLYLVKQQEIDLREIPIASITEQFLGYISVMTLLDVELAGEFIVMASTLMEIKSKLLLPSPVASQVPAAEADPRRELVRQLVEYRRFKDAAAWLEARADAHAERMERRPPIEARGTPGPQPVRAVELWDLVSAFARLLSESESLAPTPIVVDDTPQHVYESWLRDRLRDAPRLRFEELFEPPYRRDKLIGVFLALLELIKNREVWLEQEAPFQPIWLCLVVEAAQEDQASPAETAVESEIEPEVVSTTAPVEGSGQAR